MCACICVSAHVCAHVCIGLGMPNAHFFYDVSVYLLDASFTFCVAFFQQLARNSRSLSEVLWPRLMMES